MNGKEEMDDMELHEIEMWEKYKISPSSIGRTSDGDPIYPKWYNPDANVASQSAMRQAIDLIAAELQKNALPPAYSSLLEKISFLLESKITDEQMQIQKAYKDGYLKHVSGSRCNLMGALDDLSKEYYKSTYLHD